MAQTTTIGGCITLSIIGGNMAELTQLLRWNTNFVQRLAQTVLERAKAIRNSLPAYGGDSKDVRSAPVTTNPGRAQPIVKKAARKTTLGKAPTGKVVTAKKIRPNGRKATAKTKKANGKILFHDP
jgi:hypothetical protein